MLVHYTEIGVEFQIPNSNGLMSCADTLSNFIKTLLQFWPIRSTHFCCLFSGVVYNRLQNSLEFGSA